MPKAAFCGLPHSESEVYYVKVSGMGLAPSNRRHLQIKVEQRTHYCRALRELPLHQTYRSRAALTFLFAQSYPRSLPENDP